MKNAPIDELAAKDIDAQVDKVLRGLGNPPPPLILADVRALLKLDLQYYSSANDGPLREKISKLKVGAKQIVSRPTLIFDVVRKAGLRGLWLPDRKRILIDQDIPNPKKRHTEAHELIHSIAPHHEMFFLGDDQNTLRMSFQEALEGEANWGASRLLFMRGHFNSVARDMPRTFKSIQTLSKLFGNTLTMTLWRFVEDAKADEVLFGTISCHPLRLPADFNAQEPCRYFIESPAFCRQFGNVTSKETFAAVRTYATWASRGPLGTGEIPLQARDGQVHRFRLESFWNGYECLTIGAHLAPVRASVIRP